MRQVKEMFPNQRIGFNEDPGDYKQLEDVALADTDRYVIMLWYNVRYDVISIN